MARPNKMTWDGRPNFRWVKRYKGLNYRVTCADLRLPPSKWSKTESYQAANEWWEKTLATLTDNPDVTEAIEVREKLATVARQLGLRPLAHWQHEADALRSAKEPARLLGPDGISVDPLSHPETGERSEQQMLWFGRLQMLQTSAAPGEKTVKGVRQLFLDLQFARVPEDLSAGRYDNIDRALRRFADHLGESSAITSITEDRWESFCLGVNALTKRTKSEGGMSRVSAANVLSDCRQFVRFVQRRRLIMPILNLDDPMISIRKDDEIAIPTFTKTEVRKFLDHAPGQLRLHLLLMLNTGCTQKDISDLKNRQIDMKKGFIRRRRSKTMKKQGVPVVAWKLWKETLEELRKWKRPDDEEFALLTRSGMRWVRSELRSEDRKLHKTDAIVSNFRHLQRRTKISGPGKSLKIFRKTSASAIGESAYKDCRILFLGHKAKELADRNYVVPDVKRLTRAIQWLATKYGIE